MESRVKLAGHPVHPMLIVFPLGLLGMAVIFDIIYLISNNSRWTEVAYYNIGAGVIGGLLAAVFGFIDWFAIPKGTRAKRIGLLHGAGNVVVVALFALSWLLRRPVPAAPPTEAVVAGLMGLVLALITGWLGGELVDRLGVGVDNGANWTRRVPYRSDRPGDKGSAQATRMLHWHSLIRPAGQPWLEEQSDIG